MTKTLTYRTVLNALDCIDKDPDVFPEDAMTAIIVNRGVLQEARESYRKRQTALIQIHGEPVGEDNGKVKVDANDPDYLHKQQAVLDETIEVPIRTLSIDDARHLADTIDENTDGEDVRGASVSDWHWIIE